MASIYVHLSGREVDKTLLNMYGLESKEIEDKQNGNEVLKPKKCNRCDTLNQATSKFCMECGQPLDFETQLRIDEETQKMNVVMNMIMKNPRLKALIENEASGLKINEG